MSNRLEYPGFGTLTLEADSKSEERPFQYNSERIILTRTSRIAAGQYDILI